MYCTLTNSKLKVNLGKYCHLLGTVEVSVTQQNVSSISVVDIAQNLVTPGKNW